MKIVSTDVKNIWGEMRNKEHDILTKALNSEGAIVGAKKSDLYYNQSNGIPIYKEPDLEKCKKFVKIIDSGKYLQKEKENIEIHTAMDRIQFRYEDDAELQITISEKVDDAGGVTDKCSPVLVWEGRSPVNEGEDARGDGSHTVWGVDRSKNGFDVPVNRVPLEDSEHLTNAELEAIGGLLNKSPDIVKKPNVTKDGIRYLLARRKEGVPFDSPNNKLWLSEYGLTSKRIKTALEKAKQDWERTEERKKSGRVFKRYDTSPYAAVIKNKVDSTKNDNTLSWLSSTRFFNPATFIEQIESDIVFDKEEKQWIRQKDFIKIIIWHPTTELCDDWNEKWQAYHYGLFKKVFGHFGYTLKFIEMNMWEGEEDVNEDD